jgi:hypothetical protein
MLKTRDELPTIFENVTGYGAEIGVFHGDFSRKILKIYPGTLVMVDWVLKDHAKLTATEFLNRVILSENPSVEAAKPIADASLDFVYIDAGHTYESVKADLAAWIPKVRVGGIVSGHDYFNGPWDGIEFGVKQAVDDLKIPIEVIMDGTYAGKEFPTWFFKKA